jgi:hypothetical protein
VPHLDEIVAAATAEIAAAALRQSQTLTPLGPADDEPSHGSIVLVSSTTGTAAQRFYSDGLWHHATGDVTSYMGLFIRGDGERRDVYVVWTAPEWDSKRPRYIPHDADGPE